MEVGSHEVVVVVGSTLRLRNTMVDRGGHRVGPWDIGVDGLAAYSADCCACENPCSPLTPLSGAQRRSLQWVLEPANDQAGDLGTDGDIGCHVELSGERGADVLRRVIGPLDGTECLGCPDIHVP